MRLHRGRPRTRFVARVRKYSAVRQFLIRPDVGTRTSLRPNSPVVLARGRAQPGASRLLNPLTRRRHARCSSLLQGTPSVAAARARRVARAARRPRAAHWKDVSRTPLCDDLMDAEKVALGVLEPSCLLRA